MFINSQYTTNIPTDPHTITTTNMCHIHISIVSRHLASRGNNKILRTPPPHISSSEDILSASLVAQLRTIKLPFLKSYLHKVDAKSHPSPLFPLCNTHTYDTPHLFNCSHIRTTLSPLDLWTDPAGVTALLAGGPQAGTSDSPRGEMVDLSVLHLSRYNFQSIYLAFQRLLMKSCFCIVNLEKTTIQKLIDITLQYNNV